MFLHLGESTVVKSEDIVGIFDLDTTTVMKTSREFINNSSKKKKEKEKRIYISQLSSQTLNKRSGKMIFEE